MSAVLGSSWPRMWVTKPPMMIGPASLGWLIAVSLEELDDGLGCGFGFLFGGVVAGSFQDEAGDVC